MASPRGSGEVIIAGGKPETAPPELYAIVGGISDYDGTELDLSFAAKDAQDIAAALEASAKKFFGAEKVHLTLLTTGKDPRAVPPTKAEFIKAFERARGAKPQDVFVVYLSGHGVSLKRGSNLYCYLTKEATTNDTANAPLLSQRAISSEELTEWLKRIPALKQVMILDTCAAGQATNLVVPKETSPEHKRAIEEMKDKTGLHVLMGSAADAPSYEASQYGQGLLTYALLFGMQGAALKDGKFVDVQQLFRYAEQEVPQLAKNVGGLQRPVNASPPGQTFQIGMVEDDEKKFIHPAELQPVVLRPSFLDPTPGVISDHLGLSAALIKQMRAERYADHPAFIFINEEIFPLGFRPSGIYTVEGETVKISLVLTRENQRFNLPTIEVSKENLGAAAGKLVEAIVAEVRKIQAGTN